MSKFSCWKFSFAITEINYILKYIKTENSFLFVFNTMPASVAIFIARNIYD